MKKIFLALLISIVAFAECTPYILGMKQQNCKEFISTKNSLIFDSLNGRWSISSLKNRIDLNTFKCKEKAYILVNNNNISYERETYKKSFYSLKRGWNYLSSYKDGVNIVETFKSAMGVEFVYVYDKPTDAWAGYSPKKNYQNMMLNTRILFLKKIEPNKGFFVYAKSNVKVKIVSTDLTNVCKTFKYNENYAFLTDSGIDEQMRYDNDGQMGIKSRYLSHYARGIYDESRITLIYPKIKVKSQEMLKYGPAVPKSLIEYVKEYENLNFYLFDHKQNKCYQGVFPSMKTPPFASLKEMK